MLTHIELITTYIAGARLAKPGRRQTTAPTVSAPGRAGDASPAGEA